MTRLRLLRLLALRHLRRRPLRAALALLAVAAGTAMATSVLVVRTSVAASIDEYGRGLSGPTELRVVGPVRRGGLEPAVVEAVADTPGVARAVPLVQAVSLAEMGHPRDGGGGAGDGVVEQPVTVLGVDCRVEALVGDIGCTPDAVADRGDRPLAMGPAVDPAARVRTQGGAVALDGVPALDRLEAVAEGQVVVFGLDTARRLFDRDDRVDAVYVEPGPGVPVAELRARLDAVVGEHVAVLDARQAPPEVTATVDEILPLFTLVAVIGLGIGAMLVHNTVALSLEERRLDLAVVGALGGGARTLGACTLAEAALVGGLGGVAGAVGGVAVAAPIVASFSAFTERRAGIPLTVHVSVAAVAAAAVLGLVVAVASAALPVRRAVAAPPAAELARRDRRATAAAPALGRRALAWSLAAAAGLVAIEIATRDGGIEPWQVPAGALSFGLTTLTLVMAGAQAAPLALGPLGRVVGRTAAGRLATGNLRREPRRTGVMVVAVGAASTTAFLTASYVNGARLAITDDVLDNVGGVEVAVVGDGANANLDTGMSPELLAVLGDVPGARPVARRGAAVLTGARPGRLVWVSAHQDAWLDEAALRGTIDRDRFERGEAIVNAALARATGLRPGDTLRLPAPGGMFEVPIQAVVAGGGTTGQGARIPWDLFTRHYDVPPPRSVIVEPVAGTSIGELRRAVRQRVDEAVAAGALPDTRVRVLDPRAIAAESTAGVARELAPFWALQRGLVGVSFVAVLSTLLLVGLQRRRELGVLGAVGMEPGGLARMVVAEAGLVALVAVGLSGTAGLVMLWALHRVTPLLVGFDNPLAPDWWAFATWGAVALAVALVAALWPARRAARTEVVQALQAE